MTIDVSMTVGKLLPTLGWQYDSSGDPTATIYANVPVENSEKVALLTLSAIHGEEDLVILMLNGAKFACVDESYGLQCRLSGNFDAALNATFEAIAQRDGDAMVVMASDHLIGILRASDEFELSFDLADGSRIDVAFAPDKPLRWGKEEATRAELDEDEDDLGPDSAGDSVLRDGYLPRALTINVSCPSCAEEYAQQAPQYLSHGSPRSARDLWLSDISAYSGRRSCLACGVETDVVEMTKEEFHAITADSRRKIRFIREREAEANSAGRK
jgi:hypothetical protein